MATGTPVVVSRMQNRRGTQAQFDSLYPGEYISSPGAVSVLNVVSVTNTDGLVVGRPVTVTAGIGEFAPDTVVASIDSSSQFTVSLTPIVPLSGLSTIVYSPQYNGRGGATGTNILQPGEIGLCTDTRKVYIGNLNGEYLDLTEIITAANIITTPLVLQLNPSPTAFTIISELTHQATPFLSLMYSIVDVSTVDPNVIGINFSKNGELVITAIQPPTIQPPFPVTLTDTGTEINTSATIVNPNPPYNPIQPDINFKAEDDGTGNIVISYQHNFSTPLTFSTSSIIWLSL